MTNKTIFWQSDKGLAEFYCVTRSTIWRWAREGVIPQPHKIGGSTRWLMSEVEAHIGGGKK